MLNLKSILSVIVAGFLLVGCGGKISDEVLEEYGWKNAPKWVTQNDDPLASVGMAKILDKNVQFAKTRAVAAARAELAKKIKATIDTTLEEYNEENNGRLDVRARNSITETVKKLDLTNSNVTDFWIDDNGEQVYVRIKISKKAMNQIKRELRNQGINPDSFDRVSEQ